jgi:hypothetical protein
MPDFTVLAFMVDGGSPAHAVAQGLGRQIANDDDRGRLCAQLDSFADIAVYSCWAFACAKTGV